MKLITRILVAAALVPVAQSGAQNSNRDDSDSTKTSTSAAAMGLSGGLGGLFVSARRMSGCKGCDVQWGTGSQRGIRMSGPLSSSFLSHNALFTSSQSGEVDFLTNRRAALLSYLSGNDPSAFSYGGASPFIGFSSRRSSDQFFEPLRQPRTGALART